jgi:hypothetical protein
MRAIQFAIGQSGYNISMEQHGLNHIRRHTVQFIPEPLYDSRKTPHAPRIASFPRDLVLIEQIGHTFAIRCFA